MRSNSNQKSGSSVSRRKAPAGSGSASARRVSGGRSQRLQPQRLQPQRLQSQWSAKSTRSARQAQPQRSSNPVRPLRQAQSARQPQRSTRQAQPKSRTIGEIQRQSTRARREESMKRAAAKTRIPFIVMGVILAVIIAALIGLFVLSRTNTFQIEEIKFTGADHLTQQEVSALCPIPGDTTLLTVDTDAIVNNLKRDSWVEDVVVKRVFPSTLEIEVKERELAAIVEIPMGATQTMQSWAISTDGIWLMAIPNEDSEVGQQLSPAIYEDAKAAMHITGVPYGLVPEIGVVCTDDNVNNALAIVSGMTTSLADQVKTVSATDAESTTLTLDNNVEIAFGTADNVREKERICLQIMEDNAMVVYINVRVPDRPTWRSA